jgi:hypothetical protein
MIRQEELQSPRQINPHVSRHVEEAILRAMRRDPERRFQTVAAFQAALLEPPTHLVGSRVDQVQPRKAPAPRLKPPAPQEAPAPAGLAEHAAKANPQPMPPAGKLEPPKTVAAAALAITGEPSQRVSRRRLVILGLLALLLGAMGALLGGEVIGHLAVAFIVLGLLVHHARHTPQTHRQQYQVEVLVLWLGVALGYLVGVGRDGQLDTGSLLLGTAVMFWLPSAIIGAVVMRLARRRAEKRTS